MFIILSAFNNKSMIYNYLYSFLYQTERFYKFYLSSIINYYVII